MRMKREEAATGKRPSKWYQYFKSSDAANYKVQMLEWELKEQSIFLPYDSIYAIKCHPRRGYENKNRMEQYDYYAVVKNPKGNGYQYKLIDSKWIKDNFDSEFLKMIQRYDNEKGWVFFNHQGKKTLLPPEVNVLKIVKEMQLDEIYLYKPLLSDDKILWIKNVMTYNAYSTKISITLCTWYIKTKKKSLLLTDTSSEEILKTTTNNRYSVVKEDVIQTAIGEVLCKLMKEAALLNAFVEVR